MRRVAGYVFALAFMIWCGTTLAASGKIIKVLPHFFDKEGRIALSPSLYERDAYQALLRRKPDLCGGMRFDIQWKTEHARDTNLVLRLELVTAHSGVDRTLLFEKNVKAKTTWSRWSSISLAFDEVKQIGDVIAWKVSLVRKDKELAAQRSFLWPQEAARSPGG